MTGKESLDGMGGLAATVDAPQGACYGPHDIELGVRRQLLSQPRLNFNSLVVRRIDGGVCLEGVVETDYRSGDVDRLAETVAGVTRVLNRLVVRRPSSPPAKG